MTPAPTYPTPPCINPDDVTNESVFQSPASFSMFLGLKKKQMRIHIFILTVVPRANPPNPQLSG